MVYSLVSIYFDSLQLSIKSQKLYRNLDYWFRDTLNFDFLEKGLAMVSPPHFVYDVPREMFLMLHSIDWPSWIVSEANLGLLQHPRWTALLIIVYGLIIFTSWNTLENLCINSHKTNYLFFLWWWCTATVCLSGCVWRHIFWN